MFENGDPDEYNGSMEFAIADAYQAWNNNGYCNYVWELFVLQRNIFSYFLAKEFFAKNTHFLSQSIIAIAFITHLS